MLAGCQWGCRCLVHVNMRSNVLQHGRGCWGGSRTHHPPGLGHWGASRTPHPPGLGSQCCACVTRTALLGVVVVYAAHIATHHQDHVRHHATHYIAHASGVAQTLAPAAAKAPLHALTVTPSHHHPAPLCHQVRLRHRRTAMTAWVPHRHVRQARSAVTTAAPTTQPHSHHAALKRHSQHPRARRSCSALRPPAHTQLCHESHTATCCPRLAGHVAPIPSAQVRECPGLSLSKPLRARRCHSHAMQCTASGGLAASGRPPAASNQSNGINRHQPPGGSNQTDAASGLNLCVVKWQLVLQTHHELRPASNTNDAASKAQRAWVPHGGGGGGETAQACGTHKQATQARALAWNIAHVSKCRHSGAQTFETPPTL
jgi:hypothetical protein